MVTLLGASYQEAPIIGPNTGDVNFDQGDASRVSPL